MSTEFNTLDEVDVWWEEFERKRQQRFLPIRKLVDLYWWVLRLINNPPRPRRKVSHWKQRLQRGWSNMDWWNLDLFLTQVIIDGCKKFREEGQGHPADLTWEEWCEVLTKIEDGFRAYQEMDELVFDSKAQEQELTQRFEEGAQLFVKHFGNLWD